MVRVIATHMHLLQITEDHQLMWAEAADDAERESVHRRYQKQLVLAGANAVGFELAMHGTLGFITNPMTGGALLVLGAVIVYFTDRGH